MVHRFMGTETRLRVGDFQEMRLLSLKKNKFYRRLRRERERCLQEVWKVSEMEAEECQKHLSTAGRRLAKR